MNPKVTEEVKQLSAHAEKMRATRSSMLECIRSNKNSFEDDLVLCRCIVDLSAEIDRIEDTANRREILNSLDVFDVVEK